MTDSEISLNIEGRLGDDLTYSELQDAIRDEMNKAGVTEWRVVQIVPLTDSTSVSVHVLAFKESRKQTKPLSENKAQPKQADAKSTRDDFFR